ncbi:hypothetical protein [Natrinema gari]|uniref:hypothetical protein n=1 Tax=Natrinema gari TaxID=419186 RepID=UPI00135F1299|nr:hypothetical protein [Natrinema gari]
MVELDDTGRLIEIFVPIQQVNLTNEILEHPLPTMSVLLRSGYEIGGMLFRTLLLRTHKMLAQPLVVGASDPYPYPVSDRPLVLRVV